MTILDKPFYGIDEVCTHWGIAEQDLAAFVLAGELTLSATVGGIRVIYGMFEEFDDDHWEKFPEGYDYVVGTIDLQREDAWTVLRASSHLVSHLKAPEGRYVAIDDYRFTNGHTVRRDDLVICRQEMTRFEAAHPELAVHVGSSAGKPADDATSGHAKCQSGPGAPTRYDWEGFWIETCRRVYEDGVPETQGELVRIMLDWFTDTGRRVPDASTLKKKVSPLWRQLVPGTIEVNSKTVANRRI